MLLDTLLATAKSIKKSKLDDRGKDRYEEIVNVRRFSQSLVVPVSLCELPDKALRTRFNTLDPAHVQRLKESFIKDKTTTSERTLAVFGVTPNKFDLESYHGRSPVFIRLHCLIFLGVYCYIWCPSSCSKTRVVGRRRAQSQSSVSKQPLPNLLLQNA